MSKEWYKKKGFKKNPLHAEPIFGDKLFGYDALLDELFYRIEAGNILFLEGKTSKTAVLMKLIEKYRGEGKVAYLNCKSLEEEPDIQLLLAKGKKIKTRELERFPRKMIILLDNVTSLSEKNAEKIKFFFDQGIILSAILTANDYSNVSIPGSLRHRIGNRVYKLRELTQDEMIDIIQERIDFKDFLPEDCIRLIAKKTKDIKSLIIECDSAMFLMANEGKDVVDENMIERMFHEKGAR
ncbi:hypothetical protein H6503_05120 [Candidatus Woesearchaeota archaeon]|nr:hypothetical protein [Candidatus Woesearchaeota archaeon]